MLPKLLTGDRRGEPRRADDYSEVELKTALGSGSYKGNSVIGLGALLVTISFMAGCYFLWQHDVKTESSYAKLTVTVEELIETQKALIYISSLKPEDREKLNLLKPKSLKER